MADLEAVLADVSYLMAMEKSKSTPASRASKRITLPDLSVRSIMLKYLEKNNDLSFEKIFNQKIGFLLFKEFCESLPDEQIPYMKFYEEIIKFEGLETDEERCKMGREIYDAHIMKDLLSQSHIYQKSSVDHVQDRFSYCQKFKKLPIDTFKPYREEIMTVFRNVLFPRFMLSNKLTKFTQWKNLELNINLTMNDFGVHRIIGRGGFGEVYGCRKADTGKMYAMKCLDKKRIKMKQGETLALNERIMLSLVSTGEGSPFIVCMTYAFQTPEKLCFILDLMNGGDLHYHLSQHNVFSEKEVRFYASEIVLGLEHMHNRFIVYRDLKPANILLDENGHVRISDLGLACDFSKKRPYACVGTHGYMAPEVLQKGQSYDSSADWFSLGCMLYKLLRGHSPFRHHRTRDKHEIDKMTLTMNVDLPESMSLEAKSLLEGLLARDVDQRLGCCGKGALEVKNHPFFKGTDWQQVFQQKYIPPLVPPRGEVNAADAFEIGSFDEEDTKGIKLTEDDQKQYKNFPLVVSERWQLEITETVFEAVNQEADRLEQKKRNKLRHHQPSGGSGQNQHHFYHQQPHQGSGDNSFDLGVSGGTNSSSNPVAGSSPSSSAGGGGLLATISSAADDCIVEGEIVRLGGPFMQTWQKRYLKLFPNRLEFYSKASKEKKKIDECITMFAIKEIMAEFQRIAKMDHVILIILKTDHKIYITSHDKILIGQWREEILSGFKLSNEIMAGMNRKAHQMYGADGPTSSSSHSATGTHPISATVSGLLQTNQSATVGRSSAAAVGSPGDNGPDSSTQPAASSAHLLLNTN